ncbi:MAG: hypothetical protein AAGB93_22475 [Planctomycetota bacterium]
MNDRTRLASSFALTSLLFVAAPSAHAVPQVGEPPLPPPGLGASLTGEQFVVETGSSSKVLVREFNGPEVSRMVVYDVDASGTVQLDAVVSAVGLSPIAFSEDRILAAVGPVTTVVQVFDRPGTTWGAGGLLTGDSLGSVRYGNAADLDGRTAAVAAPAARAIDLYDLSANGSALLTESLPIPNARFAIRIRLDGSTLVAVVRGDGLALNGVDVLVYERSAPGWSLAQTLTPPPGIAWDGSPLSLDLDGDRLEVGMPRGDASDPCGRVYVYERAAGGFQLDAEVRGAGLCQVSDVAGTRFGDPIDLRGDVLLASSQLGGVAERFERGPGGWSVVSRHLTEASANRAYLLAGPYVCGISVLGLQLFDAVDSAGDVRVVCPSAAPVTTFGDLSPEWVLAIDARTTLAPSEFELGVNAFESSQAPAPMVLVIGTERGGRVLGPNAALCVGGALRRQAMSMNFFPGLGITSYQATVDPVALGALPGDTLLFQGWRSTPSIGAGPATTSALAVTFTP